MPHKKKSVDGGGLRHDQGKLRVDLLPADALQEVARVMTYGAHKYAERNWERGMPWSKVAGPLDRHWLDFKLGRRVDRETKLRTMAHVACNALFLLAYEMRGLHHLDDIEPFARAPKRRLTVRSPRT
jgi:hypothetical protein